MLCYDRIGFSVEIGILIETSASNKYNIRHYWYFFKKEI